MMNSSRTLSSRLLSWRRSARKEPWLNLEVMRKLCTDFSFSAPPWACTFLATISSTVCAAAGTDWNELNAASSKISGERKETLASGAGCQSSFIVTLQRNKCSLVHKLMGPDRGFNHSSDENRCTLLADFRVTAKYLRCLISSK